MTLPCERTIAVIRAKEFLCRLANVYLPGGIRGIRREVRQEALRILRHYPSAVDLTQADAFDRETAMAALETTSPPGFGSNRLITGEAPERQSPARECGGGEPLDVPQPDNGLAAGGRGHFPDTLSAASGRSQRNVVERLRQWVLKEWECNDPERLVGEAIDEIVSLRAMLTRQSDSAHRAVALMGKYAERYGFLLGGLEMVATGHTTAERVLQSAREKYPDEG